MEKLAPTRGRSKRGLKRRRREIEEAGSAGRKGGGGPGEELKGERANARSVTPHCAHLPTRPTPKFELGSRPGRSSSTRPPPLHPCLSPLWLWSFSLAHAAYIDPLTINVQGRDVSSLSFSLCFSFSITTVIPCTVGLLAILFVRSLLLAKRNQWESVWFAEMCLRCRPPARIDIDIRISSGVVSLVPSLSRLSTATLGRDRGCCSSQARGQEARLR